MSQAMMATAWLYTAEEDGSVRCHLCSHHCRILPGKAGVCRVRFNKEGRLETSVYGRLLSRNVDPIEKKPLYHVLPGTLSYSIATAGCNFHCAWCQNWEISQMPRDRSMLHGELVSPEEVVQGARATGCQSVAYTYTEPTIFCEFACDSARIACGAGLVNVFVTNGYMSKMTAHLLRPYLHAANVDLKAFSDETYRRYVGARLDPVLDSLKLLKQLGVWVEVTTLVIPDLNDEESELRDIATFIARELDPDTPWHISGFYPAYRLVDRASTPLSTLQRAYEIGKEEGLAYVYVGNVPSQRGQETLCPGCGTVLISRRGFTVVLQRIVAGRCPECHATIPGIWDRLEAEGGC